MHRLLLFCLTAHIPLALASPRSFDDVLITLAHVIEATPSETSAYVARADTLAAHLDSQYYSGLGAQAKEGAPGAYPRLTAWYGDNDERMADNFLSGPLSEVSDLSDPVGESRVKRWADMIRKVYEPIEVRTRTETDARFYLNFLRELGSAIYQSPIDGDELWRAYREGEVGDELLARWAKDEPSIGGYAPRAYFELRVELARRSTQRTVGHLALRHLIRRVAYGSYAVQKAHPNEAKRLDTYFRNTARLFKTLLDVNPPTHSGTLLEIMDGAALLLGNGTRQQDRRPPEMIALAVSLVSQIRRMDFDACELQLKEGGLIRRAKMAD